jgi:hypothetical protein
MVCMRRKLASCWALRSLAPLLALCALTLAGLARAQERGPIVLLRSPGDVETVAPLRAELGVLGWSVLEVAEDAPIEQLAERYQALAVIAVRPPRRAELYLSATDTAPRELLHLPEARDERALALKVVERLRARWLQLPRSEPERAAPVEHAASVDHAPVPRPEPQPVLWLGAGAGVLSSADGVGTLPNAVAEIGYLPLPLLACELSATWPLSTATVAAAEGSTDVRVWVLAATVSARLHRPRWDLQVGGGPILGLLQVQGNAVDRYESREDSARVRGAHFRAGFGLRLGARWWLRARGTLGLGFEEASIVVADRSVARFGRPFLLADLALAWSLL